jgi:hypothetical protein
MKGVLTSPAILAIALFVAINAGLWLAGPHHLDLNPNYFRENATALSQGKSGSWWVVQNYLKQKQPPDVVIFGSSQITVLQAADANTVHRAIDYVREKKSHTLERELARAGAGRPSVFTAAQPGGMISDYFVASKALFSGDFKPKVAIVCFSPRDFMDNTLPSVGSTEPFSFFSNYVDLGELEAVAFPRLQDRMKWLVTTRIPTRQLALPVCDRINTTVCSVLPPPSMVRDASVGATDGTRMALQLNPWGLLRPGDFVFQPSMFHSFIDNRLEYASRYRSTNPPGYKQELQFFQALLANLRKQNIETVAVSMPLMQQNRDQLTPSFWQQYRRDVDRICSSEGTRLLYLTDSKDYVQADFVDIVHMNDIGAAKFARQLAGFISADKTMAARLNAEPTKISSPAGSGPL